MALKSSTFKLDKLQQIRGQVRLKRKSFFFFGFGFDAS